jgi:hypothetical protein
MSQATTATRAEAVAAWTLHYEADTAKALARIQHMRHHGIPEGHHGIPEGHHGIPEGHHGEWLGACLALTPVEDRCAHWGDRKYCGAVHDRVGGPMRGKGRESPIRGTPADRRVGQRIKNDETSDPNRPQPTPR